MRRRVFALLFVSSCLFPDLSALSGSDASTLDATSDVTTFDAPNDTKASDAGLDVRTSPCTSPHTFCDDFDDGSLGATWDKTVNTGGSLSQSKNAISPPYSLQATAQAGGAYVLLQKFLPSANHIHYECDLMLAPGTDDGGFEVDYFDLASKPTGYVSADLNLERLNSAGDIEEFGHLSTMDAGTYKDDKIAEQFGTWKHLTVDIDYTKGSLAMAVDGTTIDTMAMVPQLPAAQATLSVGITYTSGIKSVWTLYVDNVVVDLQ